MCLRIIETILITSVFDAFSTAILTCLKPIAPIELWSFLVLTEEILDKIDFGFSKHWNSEFWLFQTLEFWFLGFPNIGILNFGFSKHWNSEFWLFQKLEF